ncbi:hypothetical protein [Tenacibaculum xiamenense]|uniref:hypothetical protein n=1 Tax=Tenacibaculum xiamenense TaxID=1261553 RepID=UPI003893F82F
MPLFPCDNPTPDGCEEEDDVVNNTGGPCLGDIIRSLQEKDQNGALVPDLEGMQHLSQVVLELFGNCSNYDLEITSEELGTDSHGNQINAGTAGITTIIIDDDLIDDATRLSIAKTLIHESMHLYINFTAHVYNSDWSFIRSIQSYYATYNNDSNLSQHNFMSEFVEALAYSLSAYDNHRQDMSYYKAMSWGGLESSVACQALQQDEKNEIQRIINNERYATRDAKSAKCP